MTINPKIVHELVDRHISAWNSLSPEAVAQTYAPDATFSINRGEPMVGRSDIAEMVDGFVSEFPDMTLTCDKVFAAGNHAIYVWTFEGHQKDTNVHVRFQGWEEWDVSENLEVIASLGYRKDS